jgi:hypothetical protein
MSLTITGKITQILDIESGTSKAGKEWKKQNFVVDTGAQFNPLVCFNLFGDDKIAALQNYSVGQDVEVSFNISSREFNGKFYHNIDAWRINAVGAAQGAGNAAPSFADVPPAAPAADGADDLPF